MDSEFRAKIELRQFANLSMMLQHMDEFDVDVSSAVRDQFPDLFSLRPTKEVELTEQENNAVLGWLINDLESEPDYQNFPEELGQEYQRYKDAITLLGNDTELTDEDRVKLLELKEKVENKHSYWGEKHRGKGFAYTLIEKLIEQRL